MHLKPPVLSYLGLVGSVGVFGVIVAACGARDIGEDQTRGSQVEATDSGLGSGECRIDPDCVTDNACLRFRCDDGRCVQLAPVSCDDGDPCTLDSCQPESGECKSEPRTLDVDGDGFRHPLPGFVPGSPGSCGNDCDDLAATAYPGGSEVCDGVDNDCNGVTDDSYVFLPSGRSTRLIAEASDGAEAGGLVHTDSEYVALVTTHDDHYQAQLVGLDPAAESFRTDVVLSNNDTFGGSLAWSGQALAVAWEDRRNGDYEIYFNRFDPGGRKLDPDLRISDAVGFSLDPNLVFTGSEYLVGWTDGRNGSGDFRVFAQRLDLLGRPLGTNVNLTPDFVDARGAAMALGTTEIGLTFSASAGDTDQIVFRAVTHDLGVLGPAVAVSGANATGGGAVHALDRYVVTWSEYFQGTGPGESIWGAVVDRNGELLQPARALTPGGGFARSHSVLAFGDRLALAWANDWGESYDIYLQYFSVDLSPLGEPVQLTRSPLDELGPRLRFGATGEVALLYTERTNDRGPRVLMETLTCR